MTTEALLLTEILSFNSRIAWNHESKAIESFYKRTDIT